MRHRAFAVLLVVVLVMVVFGAGRLSAGSPDSPAGPNNSAAQMFTLEQIYQRLDRGALSFKTAAFIEPSTAPGAGTMHTLNDIMAKAPAKDDSSGAVTTDVAPGKTFWGLTSGQWGLQTGAGPLHAAPPCFDNVNRYVDCGNGTVSDGVTGLVWLKNANCFGSKDYAAANMAAAGLKHGDCGLTDNSSAGDWRLPTNDEWEATLVEAFRLGCTHPSLTNTVGSACFSAGPQSFTGVQSTYYWSSSTMAGDCSAAYFAGLNFGDTGGITAKSYGNYVWPVRGRP